MALLATRGAGDARSSDGQQGGSQLRLSPGDVPSDSALSAWQAFATSIRFSCAMTRLSTLWIGPAFTKLGGRVGTLWRDVGSPAQGLRQGNDEGRQDWPALPLNNLASAIRGILGGDVRLVFQRADVPSPAPAPRRTG
jgi:hypothetical protein